MAIEITSYNNDYQSQHRVFQATTILLLDYLDLRKFITEKR